MRTTYPVMRFSNIEIDKPKNEQPSRAGLNRLCIALGLIIGCLSGTPKVLANSLPWDDYDRLLNAYVVSGRTAGVTLNQVDYSGLGQDAGFAKLVEDLAAFQLQELDSRDEPLAFYINAYNILTLKVVLDNWPLKSIKDVGNIFRPVWKRAAGVIDGKSVSLHEIEHERLRKMDEPRIYFAIVCASVSCPDLRMEAYRSEKLGEQLDSQIRDFLNNPGKGLRSNGDRVEISQIFAWFEQDFATRGGVEGFIRRHHTLPDGVQLRPSINYNWSLNGRSGKRRN